MIVGGLLDHFDRHDHLGLAVYGGLCVVALQKAALLTPTRHDPALRIGETTLGFGIRLRLLWGGRLRLIPARLLARARLLLPALGDLGFGDRFLLRRFLLGFGF